jgi:hypothetical protein
MLAPDDMPIHMESHKNWLSTSMMLMSETKIGQMEEHKIQLGQNYLSESHSLALTILI